MSEIRPRSSRASAPSGIARHGRLKMTNPFLTVLKYVSAALAVVLIAGVTIAGVSLAQITTKIKTVKLVGETEGPPPALGSYEGGFNILLVGSDNDVQTCRCKVGEGALDGAPKTR